MSSDVYVRTDNGVLSNYKKFEVKVLCFWKAVNFMIKNPRTISYTPDMSASWHRLKGILMQGHQVASRPSAAYPYSSLEKQKPYFKELGLDLYAYFNGTLNISIAPLEFAMTRPEFTFPLVEWTDLHPPETFSFSRCKVWFEGKSYEGWVYYPHPETKKTHFQNPSLIEVITHEVKGIQYGDTLEVEVNPIEIDIK